MASAQSEAIAQMDISEIVDFTNTGNINVMERAYYRYNPVEFVRVELQEDPTPDQAKFLMDCADITKKNFIYRSYRNRPGPKD